MPWCGPWCPMVTWEGRDRHLNLNHMCLCFRVLITCVIVPTCLLWFPITLQDHMYDHSCNCPQFFGTDAFAASVVDSSEGGNAIRQCSRRCRKGVKNWGKDIFHVFLLRGRRPYWRSSPQAHHLAQQHLTWRTCVYKYKPGFNCKYRYIQRHNTQIEILQSHLCQYNTRPLSLTWCSRRKIQIRIHIYQSDKNTTQIKLSKVKLKFLRDSAVHRSKAE